MSRETAAADALSFLGLARRAGAVATGTERARQALRAGVAKLVLVAEDASAVQLKKVEGIAEKRGIPRVALGDRVALGGAVGEPPLSAIAVTDATFAQGLLERLASKKE
jgi:ribosomal protein L7Ae-like RNA K-turn-binding protein